MIYFRSRHHIISDLCWIVLEIIRYSTLPNVLYNDLNKKLKVLLEKGLGIIAIHNYCGFAGLFDLVTQSIFQSIDLRFKIWLWDRNQVRYGDLLSVHLPLLSAFLFFSIDFINWVLCFLGAYLLFPLGCRILLTIFITLWAGLPWSHNLTPTLMLNLIMANAPICLLIVQCCLLISIVLGTIIPVSDLSSVIIFSTHLTYRGERAIAECLSDVGTCLISTLVIVSVNDMSHWPSHGTDSSSGISVLI